MSFLIYFFVLLVSAASVLFGLDLMSSPLPNTPNVPIGRSVQVAAPPQVRREKRAADERALTPVYPTEPGKPKLQVETAETAETSGAAPRDSNPQPTATPPVAKVAQAPPPMPAPKPQRTARQLAAVARAVRPVQLSPSARPAMAPVQMSESERIVRQMTRNESGDIPVQDGEGNIIIVRKTYR